MSRALIIGHLDDGHPVKQEGQHRRPGVCERSAADRAHDVDRDVRQIAQAVRAARAPGGMAARIVAIDGFGGAGKSTLAASLSAELDACPVVPTDDFASWENPLGWWPRLLLEVLELMAAGQPVHYQARDWETGGLGEWRTVPDHPFLVLEGVSSSRAAFQPYLTYAVWIDCPRAERLRRGLERDGPAARSAWERWMSEEDAWAAEERPQAHVDAIVADSTA